MKDRFAGYINLRPLNGVIYPSSIQNIIMKNFVENELNGIFYLSPTEILQAKYSVTLQTLISSETKVKGIVMLSSFMLSKNYRERMFLFKKAFLLLLFQNFVQTALLVQESLPFLYLELF